MPLLGLAALALLLTGAPAGAQYLWLDSNGDGVHTAADTMNPNGAPTTVDAWINTSHNRDGSLATCDTDDGNLQIWNSFATHVNVVGGTATFSGYVNRVPSFSIACATAGAAFVTNNSTEMSQCQATGAPVSNGGANVRMFTVTVTGTSGTPSLLFVPVNSQDFNPTSFGTNCGGLDFDNTYKLGSDFLDQDGIGSSAPHGSPPIITAPAAASGTEGQPVTITANASDPDASDILVMAATGQPASLTLTFTPAVSPVIATLSGTLGLNDQGPHTITWSVSDGSNPPVSTTTLLTVTNLDQAPVVTSPANVFGEVAIPLAVHATVLDPDGDPLAALTAAPVPAGAAFTSNATHTSGTLAWTPAAGQEGAIDVTFTATNDLGGSATTHIDIAPEGTNRPPAVTSPPTVNGSENSLVTFTATAMDPEGDPIVALTAAPLPPGAFFGSNASHTSGTFTWIPTFAQSGTYAVTISAYGACRPGPVSEPVCPRDSAITVLSIANADRAPSVSPIANVIVSGGFVATANVSASDPDGDFITLTAALPAFAVLNAPTSGTGSVATTITLSPAVADAGTYTPTVTATSNALSGSTAFGITVRALPDQPPVVTAPAAVSGVETSFVSFTATAADPDGDPVSSLTAAPLPAGAGFASNASHTSGTFSWTPNFAQSGVYSVTISARNACRPDPVSAPVCVTGSAVTTITIFDLDRPPIVVAPPSATVGEGSLLTFTVTAMDPDGEAILSLAIDPVPPGATFAVNAAHTSGAFSWLPDYTQSGSYVVGFTAKTVCRAVPGGGIVCPTTSASTTITVLNVDRRPVVIGPLDEIVDEGVRLTFGVTVTDPDGDPVDSLTAAPLPAGAAFTAGATRTSGTFDWTPSFFQSGAYLVTISAKSACRSDPISGIVCGTGTLQTRITVQNVDRPPVVAAPASRSVNEGQLLTFQATASDPDADAIESLEAAPLPTGASFTTNPSHSSGTFSWTPGFDAAGSYSVTISAQSACRAGPVSEPVCPVGSAVTAITVANVDRPPNVLAPATMNVDEGALLAFEVAAPDPDGDPIAFLSAAVLPPGATFTANATNSTGMFRWTPDYTRAAASPYTAIFVASNTLVGTALTTISVNNVDGPPAVTCPATIAAQPNQFVTFPVSAADPDGDPIASLVADLSALPLGAATFTANASHTSGTFAWGPQLQDVRDLPYSVTFTAANLRSGAATTEITVHGLNRAPVAEAGGPYSGFVGAAVLFDGSASSDPDGDPLNYSWSFGDGSTGSGPMPWHTYASALDTHAVLTVQDGSLSATDSARVHIGTSLAARAFTSGGNKTLRLRSGKPSYCVQLEPLDNAFQAADINLGSIVMRSSGTGSVSEIASTSGKTGVLKDSDGNGIMELTACFGKADLARLLGTVSGHRQVPVEIAGRLTSGAPFSAFLTLDVVGTSGTLAASVAPNPFNPVTTLSFETQRGGAVRLLVFDLAGRLVRDVTQGRSFAPGYHDIVIDGRDQGGRRLASGVYFYRLSTSEGSVSGRLVLLE